MKGPAHIYLSYIKIEVWDLHLFAPLPHTVQWWTGLKLRFQPQFVKLHVNKLLRLSSQKIQVTVTNVLKFSFIIITNITIIINTWLPEKQHAILFYPLPFVSSFQLLFFSRMSPQQYSNIYFLGLLFFTIQYYFRYSIFFFVLVCFLLLESCGFCICYIIVLI